jgi:uncharacterized cupredoxin-like copper-binding protein
LRKLTFSVLVLFILLVTGLAACSGQPEAPQTVEITLTEFGIQSTSTSFEVGQPYLFVITNSGALDHELTVIPVGTQMNDHDIEDTGHDMSGALLHVGQEELTPGATVTVEYTFTQKIDFGQFEFACHLAGHYEAGMFALISVEA